MKRGVVVITVAGEMSAALRSEFDDVEITVACGVTRIGVPGDPSWVHGIIHRLELLDLELIDVQREPDVPEATG
jgi:hypothetical protein